MALVWNDRETEGSALMRGYEEVLQRHGTDYAQIEHLKKGRDQLVEAFLGAGHAVAHRFRHEQVFDREELRRRLLSSSYVPSREEPEHAAMLDELDGLFERHQKGGEVRFLYLTHLHVGHQTVW